MCRTYPIARVSIFGLLIAISCAQNALSQSGTAPAGQRSSAWNRVGNTGLARSLAGLAGGKVLGVWYSAGGEKLFIRTESGRVFETSDLEHWRLNQSETPPAGNPANASGKQFRLGGSNLYSSDNGGQTWINLTGLNDVSLVGAGADFLASNPLNSQEIVIGNAYGVWRSADGGLTWTGLNEKLPNLPAVKLLGQRAVLLKDGTAATWGAGAWMPSPVPATDAALRARAAAALGIDVSAAIGKDAIAYAGATDGRLFVSMDRGSTWLESPQTDMPRREPSPVKRIWLDSDRPAAALAIAGNRLLRTVNGGAFWDDVTGSMPSLMLNSVTADASSSAIYAATDRGVYMAHLSLNDAGAGSENWSAVSGELPVAPALDVLFNIDGTLTAVLDGYGVFETVAPHRSRSVRLLSGADLTERAAAPGSLVSVIGARLQSVSGENLNYPVLVASEAGTQIQVPFESSTGLITLAMQAEGNRWSIPLTVKQSAPAIFVDSEGAPLLTDVDTGLVIDPKTALRSGERVQVMATGLGKVSPDWPTGAPGPIEGAPAVRGVVTAFLDGVPLEVTRAVLAAGYVGYYTVELQLPPVVNRGTSELVLVMNGERSNRVRVYLEPAAI